MHAAVLLRRTGLALLFACSTPVLAQAEQGKPAAPAPYQPRSGQGGKDVVWVPSQPIMVEKMLDMARVKPGDFVIDLGSGDGRTVIAAARRGARALGVEYNEKLVELSRRNADREGVAGKAEFVKGDFYETDFSSASVLALFLVPEILQKLGPKILALKPGTRVVSNSFPIEGWRPDETAILTSNVGCTPPYCTAYLWIVPSRVEGTHKTQHGDIILKQEFQMISGTLISLGKAVFKLEGIVNGDEITFRAGKRDFSGRMNGNVLEIR